MTFNSILIYILLGIIPAAIVLATLAALVEYTRLRFGIGHTLQPVVKIILASLDDYNQWTYVGKFLDDRNGYWKSKSNDLRVSNMGRSRWHDYVNIRSSVDGPTLNLNDYEKYLINQKLFLLKERREADIYKERHIAYAAQQLNLKKNILEQLGEKDELVLDYMAKK